MIILQSDNIDIMATDATCCHYFHIRLNYRMATTLTLTLFLILASNINFHVSINYELEALRCPDPFLL